MTRRNYIALADRLEKHLVASDPELRCAPDSWGCVRPDHRSRGGGFWLHHAHGHGVTWSSYDQALKAVEVAEATGARIVLTIMAGVKVEAAA